MMDSLGPMLVTWGIRIAGVLVVMWLAIKIAAKIQDITVRKLTARGFDETLAQFLGNMIKYGIAVMAALSCLSVFGIETTSFAAIIGAAGLAIGLAFQGSLSNVAAGVLLVTLRPYKTGDVITVAGQTGKVDAIGLLATTLDTPDNKRIIVPNSAILGGTIVNVTFHDSRRVDVSVGVDYGASMEQTRDTLLAAAQRVKGRSDVRPIQIVLVALGDSSVDWQVRIWCDTANYFAVLEEATNEIKLALDTAKIGIPYPTMDLNISK